MATNTKNNENVENNELDWEAALEYLRPSICRYLPPQDLYSLSKVNQSKLKGSWRVVALREIAKRFYILQMPLAYNGSNLISLLDENSVGSLLIVNRRFEKTPFSLLQENESKLEKKTIALKVCEYLTTEMNFEDVILDNSRPMANLNILAIFFSNLDQRARVYMAAAKSPILKKYRSMALEAKFMAEDLGMNDCEYPKSTLLLFENWFNCYGGDLASELLQRVKEGKEMTCTYILGEKLASANIKDAITEENVVALRICGPNVDSWSMDIDLFAPSDFIKLKLEELKKKVVPKQYTIGLLQALKCCLLNCPHKDHPCGDSYGLMRTVKSIFPDIRFVGFFNKFSYSTYQLAMDKPGIQQYTRTLDRPRNLHLQTSVTIITYD